MRQASKQHANLASYAAISMDFPTLSYKWLLIYLATADWAVRNDVMLVNR